jgi:hypothetical protein
LSLKVSDDKSITIFLSDILVIADVASALGPLYRAGVSSVADVSEVHAETPDSSLGIATRLLAGRLRYRGLILGRGKIFFSYSITSFPTPGPT